MHFDLRLPAIALVVGCMATTGEALTIYRLGGADVPEPDLEGKAFDFVQLYWEDVDDNRFGDSISLNLQPGSITPEVMDSNVNLAPSTLDENFLYLGGKWEIAARSGSSYRRLSVRMVDGDTDSSLHGRHRHFLFVRSATAGTPRAHTLQHSP